MMLEVSHFLCPAWHCIVILHQFTRLVLSPQTYALLSPLPREVSSQGTPNPAWPAWGGGFIPHTHKANMSRSDGSHMFISVIFIMRSGLAFVLSFEFGRSEMDSF